MAISQVTMYNQSIGLLLGDPTKQWNDAGVGAFMFVICDKNYTPSPAHTVSFDLAGVITAGDGAPVDVTGRIVDSATVPGTTAIKSNNADFGAVVTITGKYIVCVQPAVAGTFDGTNDKLVWYFDLDDTSTVAEAVIIADEFIYTMPSAGWITFAKKV